MKYLVFDFETAGLDKDSANRFTPYTQDVAPLPRENYPMQLAAALVGDDETVYGEMSVLIRGVQRASPWVLEHCPDLGVERCNREGIDFMAALEQMAGMVKGANSPCTLVAHNIKYDWFDVIVRTVHERGMEQHDSFGTLASLPQWCTCINVLTKYDRSAYFFSKIGQWIGPKLGTLAKKFEIDYDSAEAHDALYDVKVTTACLWHQLQQLAPSTARRASQKKYAEY